VIAISNIRILLP